MVSDLRQGICPKCLTNVGYGEGSVSMGAGAACLFFFPLKFYFRPKCIFWSEQPKLAGTSRNDLYLKQDETEVYLYWIGHWNGKYRLYQLERYGTVFFGCNIPNKCLLMFNVIGHTIVFKGFSLCSILSIKGLVVELIQFMHKVLEVWGERI